MTDYGNAISIPNSNFFPGRDGLKPRWIVLHGTAGGTSAEAIGNYFASTVGTGNPVSSHYVIGVDGTVVQCVAEADGAYGNGVLTAGHATFWDESVNPNLTTISIEHCKANTDNSNGLSAAQQAASFDLVNDICNRWDIPKRNADASGGITGHYSLDPVNRANCPGPYPWPALWTALAAPTATSSASEEFMIQLDTPGVSQFWSPSANGAWHCIASGHDHLMLGNIRSFYVRFGGIGLCGLSYLGLPLTDMFVPKTGTYAQLFERGLVIDDSNRVIDRVVGLPATEHCYLAHIDSGIGQLLASQPVSAPLQAQIADLKAQLAKALASTGTGNPAQLAALQSQITALTQQATAFNAKIQSALAALK